jgi:T5SS/PEP-CTERM-associated repeat protein
MMKRHLAACVCVLVGCLLGNSARAQFSGDNQTITISGVTNDWEPQLFVGYTNSSDQLQIINGGTLLYTNGYSAYIGYDTTAGNNSVLVSGSGSAWIFGPAQAYSGMYVGYSGSGNSLVINNGAGVIGPASYGYEVYLGYNAAADNNSLIISGSGSVWNQASSGGMVVGYYGSGNSLSVSSGAEVITDLDVGEQPGASNNSVLITGPGSILAIIRDWEIGAYGSANSLVISGGGAIDGGHAHSEAGELPGSDGNRMVVTGRGSVWTNVGDLIIGNSGSGNSLVISNGGSIASDGGWIGGAAVGGYYGSNNSVVVTGSGSVWSTLNALTVGLEDFNVGNSLIATNGGVLVSGSGFIGGISNRVFVTGSGSVWNAGPLDIGSSGGSGGGNTLVIDNGGAVFSIEGRIGRGSPGTLLSNNKVIVAGTGSLWINSDALYVGDPGFGNSLVITNGGGVVSINSYIGYNAGTNNNAVVSGSGSVWSNSSTLTVGSSGAGNSLVISNGGQVFDVSGVVGSQLGGSSNHVQVVGGGLWQNGALTIGDLGSSNSLVIDGGSVFATNMTVGLESPTCDNLVELDSGNLIVTNAAHTAYIDVRDGQLILKGGLLQTDVLILTNSCGQFLHTGGTLVAGSVIFDTNAFRITSITRQGNDLLLTWMMGPGQTNALQATSGGPGGGYTTNGFTNIFVVTNNVMPGTTTNFLDVGGATNVPVRYYRVRLAP